MSVALEIRAVDPVATFRQTAGPWDVQVRFIDILVIHYVTIV